MDSNKRPKIGSGDEGESSVGGMKPSGGSQSGEGSRSHQSGEGSRSHLVGGVDSKELRTIFESIGFAERLLYCIPNDFEGVDSHIISKLYELVILQLTKETEGNIASKAYILLQLPTKCFNETMNEIQTSLVFPISEKSKMKISQSVKVLQIIMEGLHADKHRIDLTLVLDLIILTRHCRSGLLVLPEEPHTTIEAIRSFKTALVAFIGAVLDDKSEDDAFSVMIPFAVEYNAKLDDDLLPLFCEVLKKNKEMIHKNSLLESIIPNSFQPIGENTSMKFYTSICDLAEILWGGHYQCIFKIQVMSWTFWALSRENIEIARRASNILVNVSNNLEGLDFSKNMGASAYVLNLIHDVFHGFSKNQDPQIFNLHINLAFKALSLTRKNAQVFNDMDVKNKIVDALQSTFCYTPSDEINEVVPSMMLSPDHDALKNCMNSFLQKKRGSSLSDLMEG